MERCWSFWCRNRAECTDYQVEHRCSTSCVKYACHNCRLLEDAMLCDRFRFPAYVDTRTHAADRKQPRSVWTYEKKPGAQRHAKEKPPDNPDGTK